MNLSQNTRAVYTAILNHPGIFQLDLAHELGCSVDTVSSHVTTLGDLIVIKLDGKRMLHFVADVDAPIEPAVMKARKKHKAVDDEDAPRISHELGKITHKCGNEIHGDRGTGQRSGIRSYRFSSGEMVV